MSVDISNTFLFCWTLTEMTQWNFQFKIEMVWIGRWPMTGIQTLNRNNEFIAICFIFPTILIA